MTAVSCEPGGGLTPRRSSRCCRILTCGSGRLSPSSGPSDGSSSSGPVVVGPRWRSARAMTIERSERWLCVCRVRLLPRPRAMRSGPEIIPSASSVTGYCPRRGGRGVATAAVPAMLDVARQHDDVRSVVLDIETDNLPSIRVAERVGGSVGSPPGSSAIGGEFCARSPCSSSRSDPPRPPPPVRRPCAGEAVAALLPPGQREAALLG